MYHSEQRQIERARRQNPDPLVTIHPDTAAGLGVAEGDWVRVATSQGSIRVRARLTDILHPRMVDVQHGWWFPERKEAEPELFGYSSPMRTFSALTARSSAARRSEGGPTPASCVG